MGGTPAIAFRPACTTKDHLIFLILCHFTIALIIRDPVTQLAMANGRSSTGSRLRCELSTRLLQTTRPKRQLVALQRSNRCGSRTPTWTPSRNPTGDAAGKDQGLTKGYGSAANRLRLSSTHRFAANRSGQRSKKRYSTLPPWYVFRGRDSSIGCHPVLPKDRRKLGFEARGPGDRSLSVQAS